MLRVWIAPEALETLHKGGGLEVIRNETGKNVFTDFKFEYPGFFDDGPCNYFLIRYLRIIFYFALEKQNKETTQNKLVLNLLNSPE